MIVVRFGGRKGAREDGDFDSYQIVEKGRQAPSLPEGSPTSLLTSSTSREGTSVSEANKHIGRNNRHVGNSAGRMVERVWLFLDSAAVHVLS
jgi:hypothetical protein